MNSDFTDNQTIQDDNLSASYQIAYAHNGTLLRHAFITIWVTCNRCFYYVVCAAKQLGERYGGNLAAYVPFANVTNGAETAKWVTDFAEPAYSATAIRLILALFIASCYRVWPAVLRA
jgi:hypothetical protein